MFFKKYKQLIFLFCLTTFTNFNYIFFFNSNYMLSYLYHNDKNFSYFLFKLILPFYTFGIFISGLHILYIIDLLGYKKTIQFSVLTLGVILIILSFLSNTIIYLLISILIGYIMAIFTVFIHNLCYSLYPKNVGIFGGLVSGGWVLSFIPISISCQFITNPNNLKPNILVVLEDLELNIYSIDVANGYSRFLRIYGFVILILAGILSILLDNPKGVKSNLSFYLSKYIFKKKSVHNSNIEQLKNNNTFSHKIDTNSQKSSKISKSIELSEITVSWNNTDYENQWDIIIDKYTIRKYLKSKIFLTLFLNFTIVYSIYILSCLKLKLKGIKYYGELFVLQINTIFLIINFFGRTLTGVLIKYYNLKYIILVVNFLLIIASILSLIEGNPIISYIFSSILYFFTVGVGVTCMRVCCRKIYNDPKISTTLQGYMENASLFGAIFELIFEVIFSRYMKTEYVLILILLINIYLVGININ